MELGDRCRDGGDAGRPLDGIVHRPAGPGVGTANAVRMTTESSSSITSTNWTNPGWSSISRDASLGSQCVGSIGVGRLHRDEPPSDPADCDCVHGIEIA